MSDTLNIKKDKEAIEKEREREEKAREREEREKEKDEAYLAFARKLANEHAYQCPTLGYHVHWIYSSKATA